MTGPQLSSGSLAAATAGLVLIVATCTRLCQGSFVLHPLFLLLMGKGEGVGSRALI